VYPHRIRLRGPWECEPLARLVGQDLVSAGVPPPLRLTMPARWNDAGLANFRGRVRLRRHFGYPGRIDAHERVWLTFAGLDGTADVRLNDVALGCRDGKDGPFEFDVTELLRPRNGLCVEVTDLSGAGGLWGEVALEVRCTAFLRGVRAWWAAADGRVTLHTAGELVGSCDGPLELYAQAGRVNVLYAPLTADGGVRPWHLSTADVPPAALGAAVLKLELVRTAVEWYVVEVPVAPANPNEGHSRL
jgi:hypothetical protein